MRILTRPARRLVPLGDSAVLIECGQPAGPAATRSLMGLCAAVQAQRWPFVCGLVPAFQSLCIHYDPLGLAAAGWSAGSWMAALAALDAAPAAPTRARLHQLPICYEGEFGLDLKDLAAHLGLGAEALIRLHAGALYNVAMIGFAPGFPYLEGLPAALHRPRRASPRPAVPAGSVAVAEDLCGIYPARLPGGWHVLGRTPVRLFDPGRAVPSLLKAGDRVRFVPVERAHYEALCPA